MLNVPGTSMESNTDRNYRRETRLWHDGNKHMPSLGCSACPDQMICGGLHLKRALYHCLDFCCGKPDTCDSVCRNKSRDFVRRVREISGFHLDSVPLSAVSAFGTD